MKLLIHVFGMTLLLASTAAWAQSTLGELLDAGGKKLSGAEVTTAVAGANMSGVNKTGNTFQADFKPDGSYGGSVQSARGRQKTGGLTGTWKVDGEGRFCTEFTSSRGPTGHAEGGTCVYLFKAGDTYFVSDSDTDRSAQVLKRTIAK
jgi:hypothetical protein